MAAHFRLHCIHDGPLKVYRTSWTIELCFISQICRTTRPPGTLNICGGPTILKITISKEAILEFKAFLPLDASNDLSFTGILWRLLTLNYIAFLHVGRFWPPSERVLGTFPRFSLLTSTWLHGTVFDNYEHECTLFYCKLLFNVVSPR